MHCKNIYFFSKSLITLDRSLLNTSSSKYELDIAKSLTDYCDITIFSSSLKNDYRAFQDNLTLVGVGTLDRKCISIIESNIKKNSILIFYGYDLKNVLCMLHIRKKACVKTIPFIFDSHKIAISKFNFFKKFLANTYFHFGKCLLNCFDGALLFQDKAAELLHIKKAYLTTKPGVSHLNPHYSENIFNDFVVTFAGTLSCLNGIDVLLEAFSEINNPQIKLYLYGNGSLKGRVLDYSKKYNNIYYGGVINDKDLVDVYKASQLLLNIRALDDEAMNYAFPSKLFEIMNSGVPAISTNLLNDEEFHNCIYILDTITVQSIKEAILQIYNNYAVYCEKAKNAKKYVYTKYNYKQLSKEIYKYINSVVTK